MKRYLTGTLLFLLTLGLAMPAVARTSLYDLERYQIRRIQQGIHSGELTRKEARILRREQRDIQRMKRYFVRDGRISRFERRILGKRYARADQHIYRLKHNRSTRYTYRYGRHAPRHSSGHGVYGFSFGYRF